MKKINTIFKLLFVVLFLIFLLAIIHIFDTKEGYDITGATLTPSPAGAAPPSVMPIATPPPMGAPAPTPTSITTYDSSNYNVQYHATAEDIQSQLDMSANITNGQDATYYTSGTLKYNPANYVPNYEDTIYFSKLTGLGYQTPTINTNAQLSGFCKYDRYFPEKIEEKCGKLGTETCAATTCCVLVGNKCMAGNYKGPYFKAHYSDLDLKNKDKYYYMGRCYGNCVDDQTNYYDYNTVTRQTFPGFAEDNPAFLPNISDYLGVISPNGVNTSPQNPNAGATKCRIDRMGNLVDSTGSVIAYNVSIDANGNFMDSNGHILSCPGVGGGDSFAAPAPAPFSVASPAAPIIMATPMATPVATPISTPVASSPVMSISTISQTPITASMTPISTPSII